MPSAPAFTKTGNSSDALKLDEQIFGLKLKSHQLIKQAYVAHQLNSRQVSASVLDRGEVRGGGKKPWRQKGTGRARHGSIRSPIWRGGGVTFGPSLNVNYSAKITKRSKRVAIRQALSLASQRDAVRIIEKFVVADGKTKTAQDILNKLGTNGRVLLVVNDKTTEVKRATDNIEGLKLASAKYINVFDIVNADFIIVEKGALVTMEEWLLKEER